MRYLALILLLVAGCNKTDENKSSTRSSGESGEDTASVEGVVEKEDSEVFVDEINVDDWSTLEAQNTAGTNLVQAPSATDEIDAVELYQLIKDENDKYNFVLKDRVPLKSNYTFSLKALAYTYYIVKYKKLTAFIPALAKDVTLPLVLNAKSSIAVTLFIRMMQTPEGKELADNKKIDAETLNQSASKIAASGVSDLEKKIEKVLTSTIAEVAKPDDEPVTKPDDEPVTQEINAAPTAILLSSSSIAENAGANATIGTLSAVDTNSGDTHSFSIVTGTGDTDNAQFNIAGTNLRPNNSFNFETKSSYTVRIKVSDAGGLSFEKNFTIAVSDVNEAPTAISLSADSIDEGSAVNSVIGTLTSTDTDAGNSFTYTLVAGTGDEDNASFNISGSSLRVSSSNLAPTTYNIRLRSTDNGGLTYDEQFVITVTAVPDTNVMHVAFYDTNDSSLKYLSGSKGSWGTPETVIAETRPNLDWENISIALDTNNRPHIGYFSTNSGGSNGHLTLYRKPAASWLTDNVINSHAVNSTLGFAQARFSSSGNMQFYGLNAPNGPSQTALYYFDPLAVGSPSGVDIYYTFNRVSNDHHPKSCVDDHDRMWFAQSDTLYNYQSSIQYGYRVGAQDPYVAGQTSGMSWTTDPCQEDITASSFNYPQLQDLDCRGGKLTLLIACNGSGGYITRLKYVEKTISAATPVLSTALTPQAFPSQPSFGSVSTIYARIARTSTGALRLVTTYGSDGSNLSYYDGTTWTSIWSGPGGSGGSASQVGFSFDSDDQPHVIYHRSATNYSKIVHWMHDGSSASSEDIFSYGNFINMHLSPDIGIDGVEGKSNHN